MILKSCTQICALQLFRHKYNHVLNYARLSVPAWSGGIWSRNHVSLTYMARLEAILLHVSTTLDPVGKRHSQMLAHPQGRAHTTRAHTHKHGRWQSIMGEIGTRSLTLPFTFSLKHTAHRHTHTFMNTHTLTRWGSEAQDEVRLTAGMSYTALVTFLAVEIKYLRLLSNKKKNKKKNSCHSNTEMPPHPLPLPGI